MKKIIEEFGEWLDSHVKNVGDAETMWTILSAIRGPDKMIYGPKERGTWPIRCAIPGMRNALDRIGIYPFREREFVCLECIELGEQHFRNHIKRAATILNVPFENCKFHKEKNDDE